MGIEIHNHLYLSNSNTKFLISTSVSLIVSCSLSYMSGFWRQPTGTQRRSNGYLQITYHREQNVASFPVSGDTPTDLNRDQSRSTDQNFPSLYRTLHKGMKLRGHEAQIEPRGHPVGCRCESEIPLEWRQCSDTGRQSSDTGRQQCSRKVQRLIRFGPGGS